MLVVHGISSDTNIDSFKCKFCNKMYSNYFSRVHHEETHAVINCTKCGKQFTRKYALRIHQQKCKALCADEREQQWKGRKIQCKVYETEFTTKFSHNRHVQLVHEEQRSFKCTLANCGKTFGRADHLQMHMKMVHKSEGKHIIKTKVQKSMLPRSKSSLRTEESELQEQEIGKPIHLTFPDKKTTGLPPLKQLKRMFYEKTMEVCDKEGFDKDMYPMFKDLILVAGRPTLRLENEHHVHFFQKILNEIEV